MILLILALVASWVVYIAIGVAQWRDRQRTYRYAVEQSNRYPIWHPAGIAYNDMATVITLGGKCDPHSFIQEREWKQESGVCCLAARMGGADEPPYLCHLIQGHDGPHRNERGEW